MRAATSSGRVRHKVRCFGGNFRAATPCANHAGRGAWMRAASSFGRVRCTFEKDWRQLRCCHAECESHACRGVGSVLRLSREVAWRIRVLGATSVQPHFVCGSHACRGAWMDATLSRESGANPEALELAPESSRTARINDCACRGLVACCTLFGGCRMAPKHWTHLLCCHAPCEISHRNAGMRTTPPSGGAVWEPRERRYVDPASFGR
jgi:hypothetical protein